MNVVIHTDKNLLDVQFIHRFLKTAYWSTGRTIEEVQKTIDHSLNFGVYLNEQQIGYARIVTDYTIFAYLMDVFIDENHRGKGYATELMKFIMQYPNLKQVSSWKLATADAHDLYKKFGFTVVENPEKMMEKKL